MVEGYTSTSMSKVHTHTHTHAHIHTHTPTRITILNSSELYGSVDHRRDLKWKFPKEVDVAGVYTDFVTLARVDDKSKTGTTPPVSS